jgi:hypothetical protein
MGECQKLCSSNLTSLLIKSCNQVDDNIWPPQNHQSSWPYIMHLFESNLVQCSSSSCTYTT